MLSKICALSKNRLVMTTMTKIMAFLLFIPMVKLAVINTGLVTAGEVNDVIFTDSVLGTASVRSPLECAGEIDIFLFFVCLFVCFLFVRGGFCLFVVVVVFGGRLAVCFYLLNSSSAFNGYMLHLFTFIVDVVIGM